MDLEEHEPLPDVHKGDLGVPTGETPLVNRETVKAMARQAVNDPKAKVDVDMLMGQQRRAQNTVAGP